MYRTIGKLTLAAIVCFYTYSIAAQNVRNDSGMDTTYYKTGWALKTNLLYDAATALNLGAEFGLGEKFTLDVPFNYNPWVFSGDKKLKHWLLQPELRYWTNQAFKGSFFGLHLHGAQFNTAHIFDGFRYQGWLAGAGVSYGYRWNFSRHWAMEATLGVGYAHIEYNKYDANGYNAGFDCHTCGYKLKSDVKDYWGLTKAGLSLIYSFGREVKKPVSIYTQTLVKEVPVRQIDTVFVAGKDIASGKEQYRCESGEACILYPLDRSELLPGLEHNPAELAKIRRSMETVREIPGARIKRIRIEAFASPEGELQHNIALSEWRAAALRDYMVQTYSLDAGDFVIRCKGENWEGLRQAIQERGDFTGKEKSDLLRIIDIQDLATRKNLLRQYRGGKIYSRLLREIYPSLRVSEYKIDYIIPVVNAGK